MIGSPSPGDEIAAAAPGTAKPCPLSDTAGYYIVLDHGGGHRTRYLHLQSYPLPGDGHPVERGQVIGYEGATGFTAPPGFVHLHFETRVNATTFTCGHDGTAVDPYAQSTWQWAAPYPGPPTYAPQPPFGYDTVGVHRGVSWFLKNTLGAGWPDCAFAYGAGTDTPLMGDWNGNGVDTVGVWNNGHWHLRNTNTGGGASYTPFIYGTGDDTPVAGDWDGDGDDNVGIVRPVGGNLEWHLRFEHAGGPADISFV